MMTILDSTIGLPEGQAGFACFMIAYQAQDGEVYFPYIQIGFDLIPININYLT